MGDMFLITGDASATSRRLHCELFYRKLLSSLHPTTISLTQSYTLNRKTA